MLFVFFMMGSFKLKICLHRRFQKKKIAIQKWPSVSLLLLEQKKYDHHKHLKCSRAHIANQGLRSALSYMNAIGTVPNWL